MVVNSVSHKDGHKLHQSPGGLLAHRKVNDEICLAHGLRVLDECELRTKKRRMKPGEYQAGLRGDSWKLDLIQAINEAREYSITREDFITKNVCPVRKTSFHRENRTAAGHEFLAGYQAALCL